MPELGAHRAPPAAQLMQKLVGTRQLAETKSPAVAKPDKFAAFGKSPVQLRIEPADAADTITRMIVKEPVSRGGARAPGAAAAAAHSDLTVCGDGGAARQFIKPADVAAMQTPGWVVFSPRKNDPNVLELVATGQCATRAGTHSRPH